MIIPGFIDPFHFWMGIGGAYPTEPVYSERGSERIAVDQPQGGSRYPFVDPDESTRRLVVDFYLAYEDEACEYQQPFRITYLRGFGILDDGESDSEPESYEIIVQDANDAVVFDSADVPIDTDQRFQNDWGILRRVLGWKSETAVCRLVFNQAILPGEEPLELPINYYPESASLDTRTIERMCPRIKSLIVKTEDGYIELTGTSLVFAPGYNTKITPEATDVDGELRTTAITIDHDQNTGLGRFDADCDDAADLHRLNNVNPDSGGAFLLQTSDCYRIEIPHSIVDGLAVLVPHTLQLKNDCVPCCSCEGYAALYEAIKKLYTEYNALADRAEAVRDQYRENLERWREAGAARYAAPLRLTVIPLANCTLGVSGGYCNSSGEYIEEATLKFTFTDAPGTGSVVCGSEFRSGSLDAITGRSAGRFNINSSQPYTLEGSWPTYTARFVGIPAGGIISAAFQVEFEECAEDDPISVTMGAYAADGSTPLTYDSSWPDGTTFDPISPVSVSSNLFPDDPCSD